MYGVVTIKPVELGSQDGSPSAGPPPASAGAPGPSWRTRQPLFAHSGASYDNMSTAEPQADQELLYRWSPLMFVLSTRWFLQPHGGTGSWPEGFAVPGDVSTFRGCSSQSSSSSFSVRLTVATQHGNVSVCTCLRSRTRLGRFHLFTSLVVKSSQQEPEEPPQTQTKASTLTSGTEDGLWCSIRRPTGKFVRLSLCAAPDHPVFAPLPPDSPGSRWLLNSSKLWQLSFHIGTC